MATWTAAEVRNAVLEHLGVKAKGVSAAATDAQKVDDLYTSEYPRLRKEGLAPWAKGTVDEGAWDPLTRYLAGKCGPKFGYTGQRLLDLKTDMEDARKDLQAFEAGQTNETARLDFF